MGKLVRNLSTKEHRAWWDAVKEAARLAPTLTYPGPVAKTDKATDCKPVIVGAIPTRTSRR